MSELNAYLLARFDEEDAVTANLAASGVDISHVVIDAHRAVVELHAQVLCDHCRAFGRAPGTACRTCGHGAVGLDAQLFYDGTCSTTRALAQIYADRDDFDPTWRAS